MFKFVECVESEFLETHANMYGFSGPNIYETQTMRWMIMESEIARKSCHSGRQKRIFRDVHTSGMEKIDLQRKLLESVLALNDKELTMFDNMR